MAMCNDSPTFNPNKNNYYTTKQMWSNISHLIPKDKIIWEACMLNSKSRSVEYFTELGFNCVGDTSMDCLTTTPEDFGMIITNPPFETKLKQKILCRFIELDKPFILILNCMNFYSKYFRDIFKENIKYLQVVIPQGKITFEEYCEEQERMIKCPRAPSFYCAYLCYKLDIPADKLWLEK
tara:strand:+ start:553 stop:1092 length:540 start_codon:yes stop_codon:yes gene_type:complete